MELRISIKGKTPLICNRFTDEQALAASSGSRGSSAGIDRGTPQEIAEKSLYLGLDGNPMIPQPNLLRCIVEGGRFEKIGKAQVTTNKSSLVYACLDLEGVEMPIIHEQRWMVDTRPVRIPATGGRILRHRSLFWDWRLDFTANLDTTIMGEQLLRRIVDHAGTRIGLGDFRPHTKGPYGKFDVVHWQVIELKMAA